MAETRKVWSDLMPSRRNSSTGKLSPRSDLFSTRKTGLRDLRADLAICLSLSLIYFDESKVRRIKSAASIASAIWS